MSQIGLLKSLSRLCLHSIAALCFKVKLQLSDTTCESNKRNNQKTQIIKLRKEKKKKKKKKAANRKSRHHSTTTTTTTTTTTSSEKTNQNDRPLSLLSSIA
ncbi:hypothetical protein CAOG_009976 [Capsaspora owczarzaki ATCC 30864]|uniref:Uncharacterized protein n=1 Tax=Capsaspora owczarzaki (strain ATCC 30864) TaxID=595528 RepID=A0A0D2ULF3_CAPO3|nr:hypothetical protein CAOG_009976 [Capsaspora owczarzaki ATCC 30864]